MPVLKIISDAITLAGGFLLFLVLYDPICSKKKSALITLLINLPITAALCVLYVLDILPIPHAALIFSSAFVLTVTMFFFSKHRGLRFIFTLFAITSLSIGVSVVTVLADIYIFGGAYIFALVARAVIFIAASVLTLIFVRPIYFTLLETIKRGWTWFSVTAFLILGLLTAMNYYPTNIVNRPDCIPMILIVILLMPLVYYNIFQVVYNQHRIFNMTMRDDIVNIEKAHIEDIVKQNAQTEERIRIERHDLRHRLRSILTMLESEEYEEAKEYIHASSQFFNEKKTERYCQNPIIDSVFAAYFSDAEKHGIKIQTQLAVPNELPIDASEFSIVVANAIENAINACKNLPEDKRIIRCKYVIGPRHMFQIANPYQGKIEFDEKGRPLTFKTNHGIGTRSIVAFAEKHNAQLNYKTKDGWFYFRIVF